MLEEGTPDRRDIEGTDFPNTHMRTPSNTAVNQRNLSPSTLVYVWS